MSIQPAGTNKIDNAWKSGMKSNSFKLAESPTSLDYPVAGSSKCSTPVNNNNLHEMDTQIPYPTNNESSDSIYSAATQLLMQNHSPSFHSKDTQLPEPDYLLNVDKISEKQNMELDLFGANKENNNSLYNAETQIPAECEILNKANITDSEGAETQRHNVEDSSLPNECKQNDIDVFTAATQLPDSEKYSIFTAPTQLPILEDADTQMPITVNESMPAKLEAKTIDNFGKGNRLVDEILFDEIDNQSFLEEFNSQPLLQQEHSPEDEHIIIPLSQTSQEDENDVIKPIALKRAIRIESDSTDCDDLDVLQTQKNPARLIDDDLTDCEDDIDNEPNKLKIPEPKTANFEDITTQSVVDNVPHKNNFEDLPTQIIGDYIELNNDTTPKCVVKSSDETIVDTNLVLNIEDMATQVIDDDVEVDNEHKVVDRIPKETMFEDMATQVLLPENKETDFAEIATQVIDEIPAEKVDCSNAANTQYSEEIVCTFKVPYSTPLKTKMKNMSKSCENKCMNPNITFPKSPIKIVNLENDEKYYAATQELYDDLCSQRESSPVFAKPQTTKMVNNSLLKEKQIEIINVDDEAVPSLVECHKLADRFQHIENETCPERKYIVADNSSDNSDGDERINKFVLSLSSKTVREVIGVDEDVTNVKRVSSDISDVEVTPKKVRPFKFIETELPSSQEIKTSISMTSKTLVRESSSDSEPEPERDSTPLLFRKKTVKQAKINLTKKFEGQALPTRVITRVRKPTSKIQGSDEETKKLILPDFHNVNKEIISENICRLKTKTDKIVNKDSATRQTKSAEVKKESKARRNFATNKKNDEAKAILDDQENEPLANRSKVKNKTLNITDETNSKTYNKENDESINPTEEKTRSSSRSTRRTKQSEKSEKSDSKSVSMEKPSVRRSRHQDVDKTVKNVCSTSSEKNENTALLSETRSTRRKLKDDKISNNKDDSTKEHKRKRGRPRKTDNRDDEIDITTEKVDISKQIDIRRSKRQRTVKVIETKQNDRNNKNKLAKDQSTVYNISSESSVESPRPLKRSAGDYDGPSPKRTRSSISSNTSIMLSSNMSSMLKSNRSTVGSTAARGVKTHYVLFTAFPYEEVKTKLETLGKHKMLCC